MLASPVLEQSHGKNQTESESESEQSLGQQ